MDKFDAKQIVNASMGPLGAYAGIAQGPMGEWAQYSPEKYFDTDEYYHAGDTFDPQTYYSSKTVMREVLDEA